MTRVIVSVSTVKDTPDHVTTWVRRNLAQGVDHMVVFVDDGDAATLEALACHAGVTAIDGPSWWGQERPARLNVRQRLSSNAVLAAATRVPGVEWVLHHDADEVAVIDRPQLRRLHDDVRAVRLSPLEAVSRTTWPDDRVTDFKRLLGDDELELLVALGVIGKAGNAHYFHGHIGGKVAIRPTLGAWLGTHHMVDADRQKLPCFEAPWLRLLHYESFSFDEFVRKWSNLSTSGGAVITRGARSDLLAGFRALLAAELDDEAFAQVATRLFDRHVRDDHDLLRTLGFLVQVDPDSDPDGDSGAATDADSEAAAEGVVSDLAARVQSLAAADKGVFDVGGSREAVESVLDAAVDAGESRSRSAWIRRRR